LFSVLATVPVRGNCVQVARFHFLVQRQPVRVDGRSTQRHHTSMKIATFNVNGINGRLPVQLRWLAAAQPDVVWSPGIEDTGREISEGRPRKGWLRRHLAWPEELEWCGDPGKGC